jgi:hypothetical protein
MHLVHIVLAIQLACAPVHMLCMAQLVNNAMIGVMWWAIVCSSILGISLISLTTNTHTFHRRSKVSFRLSCVFCAAGALLSIFDAAQVLPGHMDTDVPKINTICDWFYGTIFVCLLMFTYFSDCASTQKNMRLRVIRVTTQPWSTRSRLVRTAFTGITWTSAWCFMWVVAMPIFQLVLCPPTNSTGNMTILFGTWDKSFVSIDHFLETWPTPFSTIVLASLVLALTSLVIPWHFRLAAAFKNCDALVGPMPYTTTWARVLWPAVIILCAWMMTCITAGLYLTLAASLDTASIEAQKYGGGLAVVSIVAVACILVLVMWTTFVSARLMMM